MTGARDSNLVKSYVYYAKELMKMFMLTYKYHIRMLSMHQ